MSCDTIRMQGSIWASLNTQVRLRINVYLQRGTVNIMLCEEALPSETPAW